LIPTKRGESHDQAFEIVDCTACAYCCKTLAIRFNDQDIQRIAGRQNMRTSKFIATYLEADKEESPCKTRQKPCPFLGEGDNCTIREQAHGLS